MQVPRRRFAWRALTSVIVAISSLALLSSGAVLFLAPPGRIANWTDWNILGLAKSQWAGLHISFAAVFIAGSAFHVAFNWRPLASHFKSRVTRRPALRWEWVLGIFLCGLACAATIAGVPPFSSLISLSEDLRCGWEDPRRQAPVPHAELLTLEELAEKAGVDMETATRRLEAKGISVASPRDVVQEIAGKSPFSAEQIYRILSGEPEDVSSDASHEPDQESRKGKKKGAGGEGRGGEGRGGGGPGGGMGQRTLAEYCAAEGMEISEALQRLKSKGIEASQEMTLREIARKHGMDRPHEVMEMLK